MIRDFEIGDLVKWKSTRGFEYATILEKRPDPEFGIRYTCLHEGKVMDTGFRNYMTLVDEPHEATLQLWHYQFEKEKESC